MHGWSRFKNVTGAMIALGAAIADAQTVHTVTNAADAGAGTLRQRFLLAEGDGGASRIVFAAGVTQVTLLSAIAFNDGDAVSVEGGNAVTLRAPVAGLLNSSGSAPVHLSDLALEECSNGFAFAIDVRGALSLSNVVARRCEAGFRSFESGLDVADCRFEGNGGEGSLLAAQGLVQSGVRRCRFVGNRFGSSLIRLDQTAPNSVLEDSVFEHNQGQIWMVQSSNVTAVGNCVFQTNVSLSQPLLSGVGRAERCLFESNAAAFGVVAGFPDLDAVECFFVSNDVASGALLGGATTRVERCEFRANSGFAAVSAGQLLAEDTVWDRNNVGETVSGDGVSLSRCEVTGNGSALASGIVRASTVLAVSDTLVERNEAGGILIGGAMTVSNVTFRNNVPSAFGLSASELAVIQDSVLRSNSAPSPSGVLLSASGGAVLERCVVEDNGPFSSACLSVFGDLRIEQTLVQRNRGNFGGALSVFSGTQALVEASTFVSNSGVTFGSAMLAGNTELILRNSTFAGNPGEPSDGIFLVNTVTTRIEHCTVAGFGGVGISNLATSTSQVELVNSIVALNGAGDVRSGGDGLARVEGRFTLIGDGSPLDVTGPGIVLGDPMLEPLADNGGLTPTRALASNSPAINAGTATSDLTFDQRGAGFPRLIGTAVDLGAVESPVLQTSGGGTTAGNGSSGGTGGSSGGTAGTGSGSGGTGGSSGETGGSSGETGGSSGGTGSTTGATGGTDAPQLLDWTVRILKPKEGKARTFSTTRGFGTVRGVVDEVDLEPGTSGVRVQIAFAPVATNAGTGGVETVFRAVTKVSRVGKRGRVKFVAKAAGRDVATRSGDAFDLLARATEPDADFDELTTPTTGIRFSVR